MKHRAPQFDLPGTEYVFNLSGEQVAPEATAAPAVPAQDRTQELFPGRPCSCHDLTWGGKGYHCLNCGATADHTWNIKHQNKHNEEKRP